MKKKEVKRLSKPDLLEILIQLKKQNNKLREDLDEKTAELEKSEAALQAARDERDKMERELFEARVRLEENAKQLEVRQQNNGQVEAVTEAALRINDVFAKALEAADQYIRGFQEKE